MKLLIVIVNYRSADLTIDCLRSLAAEVGRSHVAATPASPLGFPSENGDAGVAATKIQHQSCLPHAIAPESEMDGDVKVIVTDNKSPDDSVERLNAAVRENGWSSWVSVQPLERNGGFAYGNNAAINPALAAADRPEFVLLLNPDTVVRSGAIAALLDFMRENPKVGIAGSRLEDPDGTPQRSAFRFHSIAGEFERGIRMGFVTRILSKRMIAPPVPDRAGPCDWVAGASMIVRREVFESAGLMDERYFMYFEEVDFCLAAARKGWACWYVPASRVVHLVGAVSQMSDNRKHRTRRPAYWFESRRRYFVKNHGRVYAALADMAYLTAHACWRLRRLVQGKEDTDPPRLLMDSISHSVFVRGWTF